ncbi:protein containing tetratricopeptide repeats [Marinobacter nauticus VT8]|uniref:Protein containing tetratricopeptide repeats n=1 Tax=Marinobacter nauticus (strain ATCC 700491 / DSM 11845 / VT8) TaxID=351348 RepID=A1U1M7_MARN8|nr:protein containing tetratricopeptide repeats [Marinobacter nauticus VT8]
MGLTVIKPFRTRSVLFTGALLWLTMVAPAEADEPRPERAKDLRYGWALYEYHQGNVFEALTQLSVAREQGGIEGHGDHPALVEGGLMLSWGMTREASKLFTELLGSDGAGSTLSPEVRNQAWFYLGKVFFLEGNRELAGENLERVDGEILAEANHDLFREWVYLQARVAMMSSRIEDVSKLTSLKEQLEDTDIWSLYLQYNSAVAALDAGDVATAEAELQTLIAIIQQSADSAEPEAEREGLLDRARLSLARHYLRDDRFDAALEILADMSLNGVFADQALFDYAVAAAGQGRPDRALDALDTLSNRNLFLPWRQQVPFARAYVLEQMSRPQRALSAFKQAADLYQARIQELDNIRNELSERSLMAQLDFTRDSDGILTDSYGRLRVQPADFGMAEVLASETFQQALAELNELYQMQSFIAERQSRFESFRIMLETREQQRQVRIAETRRALENQQADQWQTLHEEFRETIATALAEDDAQFFMTAEQKALRDKLNEVEETLAGLPDDATTASQRETYRRMRAYFDWWIADDYGVNRWAAQKQLRELDREMQHFQAQRQRVETLMSDDDRHAELARRISASESELATLGQEVAVALSNARRILLSQVDSMLVAQQEELNGYLVASRHAQARLADQLFRRSQNPGAGDE